MGLLARKLFSKDADMSKEGYFMWGIIGAICGIGVLLVNGWSEL